MREVGAAGAVGEGGEEDGEVDRVEDDVNEELEAEVEVEVEVEANFRPRPPEAGDTGSSSPRLPGSIPSSLGSLASQKRRRCRARPGCAHRMLSASRGYTT